MPIINRSLDPSQQKVDVTVRVGTAVAASAGISYNVFQAPWPCTIISAAAAASGLSGAPTQQLEILRFNGVGGTSLLPASTGVLTVLAYGTSAAFQGFSMVAAGSTLLNMQTGDVLQLNQLFSGGNVAVRDEVLTVVVQPIQDILQHFGV